MALLGESRSTAYARLTRLTAQKRLTHVGVKYYPYGAVAPPEEHYAVIRAYLEREGFSYRKELSELLRLEPRQCTWILHGLVEDGKLIREKQRYTLPEEK